MITPKLRYPGWEIVVLAALLSVEGIIVWRTDSFNHKEHRNIMIIKTIIKISIPLFLLSIVFFFYVKEDDSYDRDIVITELKKTATASFLEQRIQQALTNEQIDDAEMYSDLADWLKVPLDAQLMAEINQADSQTNRMLRMGKNAIQGFITGDTDNAAGVAGSIAADLTPYGDLRDFTIQTKHYLSNENVDKFVYGFAVIGLATSVATYFSAGAAAPIDTDASVLKTAKKTGNISSGLTKTLEKNIHEVIDFGTLQKQLKAINLTDTKLLKETVVSAVKKDKLAKLGHELAEIKKISNSTGSLADTVKVMKYADNMDDMKQIGRLAGDFKGHTKGILAVLGKKALRVTRFVAAQLVSLFFMIASLLTMLFSLVISLLSGGMTISTILFRKRR